MSNSVNESHDITVEKRISLRALEATNFFLADVQTGLGPFLAAFLAAAGWKPGRVGLALTVGGVITVLLQTPAGALVDRVHAKRAILVAGAAVLACGAMLLFFTSRPWAVYASQILIGGAGPFLAPTLAAITMGLVGVRLFDRQFGRNQSFNAAGNVACALLIAGVSHLFGTRAIFITAAILTIPTVASVLLIRRGDIDYDLARGCGTGNERGTSGALDFKTIAKDRLLVAFLACAFLFHLANAAMLPELGEMLAKGSRTSAAPFMSACIIVTQVVIMCTAATVGKWANLRGRKPLLLIAFGVLPLRAVLYTIVHREGGLIAVQILDGVANTIFGVVSILVIADRTRGMGRFNLMQGALATAVGLGAALSNILGGSLVHRGDFRISFLVLGSVALGAFLLLFFAIPETLRKDLGERTPVLHKQKRVSA